MTHTAPAIDPRSALSQCAQPCPERDELSPEQMAGLTASARATVASIADPDVRLAYGHDFKRRLDELRNAPLVHNCIRAPNSDTERRWVKFVCNEAVGVAPAVLDVPNVGTFAVVPIGATYIEIIKAV